MRHFTEGELLDLAEGARPELFSRPSRILRGVPAAADGSAFRHRGGGGRGRAGAFAAVLGTSVGARARSRGRGRPALGGRVAAALAIVASDRSDRRRGDARLDGRDHVASRSTNHPPPRTPRPGPRSTDTAADAGDLAYPTDDPSLTLLADLTSDLDWDAASEAGPCAADRRRRRCRHVVERRRTPRAAPIAAGSARGRGLESAVRC